MRLRLKVEENSNCFLLCKFIVSTHHVHRKDGEQLYGNININISSYIFVWCMSLELVYKSDLYVHMKHAWNMFNHYPFSWAQMNSCKLHLFTSVCSFPPLHSCSKSLSIVDLFGWTMQRQKQITYIYFYTFYASSREVV